MKASIELFEKNEQFNPEEIDYSMINRGDHDDQL